MPLNTCARTAMTYSSAAVPHPGSSQPSGSGRQTAAQCRRDIASGTRHVTFCAMPDTRSHRGPHPEDAVLFAHEKWPALQGASADLCWLLDRGYAMRSALTLVGDRYALAQRQRLAVARSTCAASDRDRRLAHQAPVAALRDAELWIDGYNLLITVEAALAGGGPIVRTRRMLSRSRQPARNVPDRRGNDTGN